MKFSALKSTQHLTIGILLCVLLLTACGGGEQTGATDVYGAYEVIERGMSEA